MEKIIGISKVSRGYQITLLEDVRKILGIDKIGDKIIYVEKDGEIIIRKA
jgi:bifunctional DNA-binding transcriptional regulator/antitoxin component of YhaV-PrlF toxin-antitoxin module